MDLAGTLRDVGLTRGEAQVYLALLDLGPSTTGPVVRESRISSSKAYEVLDRLMEKGLVTSVLRGTTRVYEALDPSRLRDYLARREQEIQQQRTLLAPILPMLSARRRRRREQDASRVFHGYQGIRSYFSEVFQSLPVGAERLVLGAHSGYSDRPEVALFFRHLGKRFAGKKIRTRIIFSADRRASAQHYRSLPYTQVRFLDHLTPASVGIQGDNVDILVWTPEKKVLFAITCPEVAQSYREYFRTLWKLAAP